MRLVVVSSLTPIATANHLVDALSHRGHTLLVLSDVPAPAVDVVCGAEPDVARVCAARNFVPDAVLFVEGGTMQLLPRGLEKLDCPTAWYAIDTHMDYPKHACLARLFDLTFVAQKQYVARLQADSGRPVEWLPLAFPSEHLGVSSGDRPIDLAFVGSTDPRVHPRRVRLLQTLAAAQSCAVSIGQAAPAEMLRRYRSAKVVFNQSVNNDLNMRYFEAMGSGAVLLTDPVSDNGVEDLFEAGKHFVLFRDEADLVAQFKALLADPGRRAAIGHAAHALVAERHTYENRVDAIVDRLESLSKMVVPDPAAYFAAFAALNMPAETLRAASETFAAAGAGSRLRPINQGVAILLCAAAMVLRLALRLIRRGHRQ